MYISNQASHVTYVKKITVADEEILKSKIKELHPTWTHHNARKISIAVDKDCEIVLNGTDTILVSSDYGLVLSYEDIALLTLTTKTKGVNLYMIISY